MGQVIHLLGAPRVERDGEAVPAPRGHKVWGLLAYLLLARGPVPRGHLTSLLFAEAGDPLAALRWNLAAVRRLLGSSLVLRGDPLVLRLEPPAVFDVEVVASGSWADVEAVGGLGLDLLDSMAFPACPSFEVWLETERRHVRGAAEAQLREAALSRLTSGDPARAADLAGELVRMNPYDENYQALLVRSLASAGLGVAAARQVASCRELFRRELGVEPGPALAAAAATLTATPTSTPAAGRAGVVAQVEAGQAAIGAGVVDAGLQCLRRAATDATSLAERDLRARALTALGSALVHAARGCDEEGATALHEAVAIADGELPDVVAEASRELAYIEFLRGRYDRVEVWLARAESAAHGDSAHRARILTVRGSAKSDVGRYEEALEALEEALTLSPDDRVSSYALSMIGRVHLLRQELDKAAAALDESLRLATRQGWAAFVPWPESLRAGVDLAGGDLDRAEDRLDHAFALSCHIGDPCWEGIAARGLGLVRAARGDSVGAVSVLRDARTRGTRLPDGYLWLDAYTLDALCAVALGAGAVEARRWVDDLAGLATQTGMRELSARALFHRGRLGDEGSFEAAAAMADGIDNPDLERLTASGGATTVG